MRLERGHSPPAAACALPRKTRSCLAQGRVDRRRANVAGFEPALPLLRPLGFRTPARSHARPHGPFSTPVSLSPTLALALVCAPKTQEAHLQASNKEPVASKSTETAEVAAAEAAGVYQRRFSEELGLLREELMSAETAGTELHNHAVSTLTEILSLHVLTRSPIYWCLKSCVAMLCAPRFPLATAHPLCRCGSMLS